MYCRTPLLLLTAALLPLGFVAGCGEPDSPEEAATQQRLEESSQELGDSLREAGSDLADTASAAGRRAGQALEDGAETLGEAMEDSGRRLQDAARNDEVAPPPTTRPIN